MLFTYHNDIGTGEKDFFEMNPGANAVKEFKDCTSRQMFFVGLVADRDRDSPLRTLSERTRREKATVMAGYPLEGNRPDKNGRNLINGKVAVVEVAIKKYYENQFDEERAMLDAVNAQIQETLDMISSNKIALATITKTTVDKKTGASTKEEHLDAKMLSVLRAEARKAAVELPALKEAKAKLLNTMNIKPAMENLTTFTNTDLVNAEGEDVDEEGEGSTLDQFNEKRFKQTL